MLVQKWVASFLSKGNSQFCLTNVVILVVKTQLSGLKVIQIELNCPVHKREKNNESSLAAQRRGHEPGNGKEGSCSLCVGNRKSPTEIWIGVQGRRVGIGLSQ